MIYPLLSICIPTYNRVKYLEQCIKSIIYQEGFDEIEVIVSDNCSNDGTMELCQKFEKLYENFHYFRNSTNVVDMNFPLVFK